MRLSSLALYPLSENYHPGANWGIIFIWVVLPYWLKMRGQQRNMVLARGRTYMTGLTGPCGMPLLLEKYQLMLMTFGDGAMGSLGSQLCPTEYIECWTLRQKPSL